MYFKKEKEALTNLNPNPAVGKASYTRGHTLSDPARWHLRAANPARTLDPSSPLSSVSSVTPTFHTHLTIDWICGSVVINHLLRCVESMEKCPTQALLPQVLSTQKPTVCTSDLAVTADRRWHAAALP